MFLWVNMKAQPPNQREKRCFIRADENGHFEKSTFENYVNRGGGGSSANVINYISWRTSMF